MADLFLPPLPPNTPAPSGRSSVEPGIHSQTQSIKKNSFTPGLSERELLVQTPMVNQTTHEDEQDKLSLSWDREIDSVVSPFDDWVDDIYSTQNPVLENESMNFQNAPNSSTAPQQKNTFQPPSMVFGSPDNASEICLNNQSSNNDIVESLINNVDTFTQRNNSSISDASGIESDAINIVLNDPTQELLTTTNNGQYAGKNTPQVSIQVEPSVPLPTTTDFLKTTDNRKRKHHVLEAIPNRLSYIPPRDSPLTNSPCTSFSSRNSPSSFSRSSSVASSIMSDNDENIR